MSTHVATETVSIRGTHRQMVQTTSSNSFKNDNYMKSMFPDVWAALQIDNRQPWPASNAYKDYFQRKLSDDTFHWKHNLKTNDARNSNVFLNIDNKYNLDQHFYSQVNLPSLAASSYSGPYEKTPGHYLFGSEREFMAHSQFFGNPKLNGTTINYGERDSITTNASDLYWNDININFNNTDTFLSGTHEDEYLYKTIEEIGISNSIKYGMTRYIDRVQNGFYQTSITSGSKNYNNVRFVPRELDLFNHNKVLFDVYMENDNGTSVDNDHLLDKGKLETTGVSGHLNVSFVRTPDQNKFGEIVIDDSTYYDYDAQSTKTGVKIGAQRGELIPYNFSGEYNRMLTMELNASMGDIKINLKEDIVSPILDPYIGIYKLRVKQGVKQVFANKSSRFYINKERLENFIDNDLNYRIETFAVRDNE